MSTGSPIYLVSACVSGEEFVAAFRRYADRNGLFVPMAEPLPVGRRGRFALTLRDGGVMVEGDAEIVSSGKLPSSLYGRVGMTLKFVEPDEQSKQVLVELEKARLAMKPAAPSIPPRPATIPAAPRPVAPPVAGRIDANNALAECVAIGDVEALAVVETKPGPKFIVPSIPPVGAPRPHTPSTPPMPRAHRPSVPPMPTRPKPTTDAPAIPPIGKSSGAHAALPVKAPIATSPPATSPPATNPTPTVPTVVPSTKSTQPSAVVPPPGKSEPVAAAIGTSDTLLAMRAPHEVRSKITRTQPAMVAPPPERTKPHDDDDDDPIEPPEPARPRTDGLVPVPQTDTIDVDSNLALIASDTVEIAAVEPPPDAVTPPPADEQTQTSFVLPLRPPAKPAAKNGTPPPALAPPIVPAGARSFVTAEDIEIAEPTELSEIDPEIANSSRRTTIGVAVVPEGVTVLPAKTSPAEAEGEVWDTFLMEAQQPTAGVVGPRTIDGRAPTVPPLSSPFEVQEPTPSGDWTIQTSARGPEIEPVKRVREPSAPATAPADRTKLPTGDWTIALSSDSPDGWSEPSKLEKPRPVSPGPPMAAVASAEPLDSKPDTDRPAEESGPKVQIDPTLIQPLTPMPGDDNSFTPMLVDALAMPAEGYPQQHPIVPIPAAPMAPGAFPTPMPRTTDPSQPAAMPFGPQPNARPLDARGSAPHLPAATASKRRLVVIVGSALLVVAIGVVAVIVLAGRKKETAPRPAASGSGSAASSVGSASPPAPPAGEVTSSAGATTEGSGKPAEAIAPDTCNVAITTVPDGADLVIDNRVVGRSNQAIELPCNVETKVVVRKAHFVSQTKSITPKPDDPPLKLALSRLMFTVKVSSKPPGAAVTSSGKPLGVTPMITKLPAFEPSTLVFAKDGFEKATQKITPKANNTALQATLHKKKGRR